MSNIERMFPFERSEFSKYGYLFLLAIISISSLMDRGAFSSSYHHDPFIVIIPLVLSSYLLIIWCMRLTGLNPNKFEMVFIPLIILSTIFFILTFMDSLPKIDEGDTTSTTEESGLSKSSAPSVSASSGTQIGTTQNTFLPAVDNGLNSQVRNFLGIIFPMFIIIVVAVLFFTWNSDWQRNRLYTTCRPISKRYYQPLH
ncbi:MAG: hypothetical protein ACXAB7_13495 [Candidatus Kariarchaeaceae archaeon]